MKCVYCDNEESRVIETREAGDALRRRRECTACAERFTTYERVEQQPVRIIKKDGNREFFDRDKLRRGFMLACEKRPVSTEQIENAISEIENQLRKMGEPEVHSNVLGELAMKQLRLLDDVAYIRFASVYKEFRDAQSFEQEVKVLTRGN